MIFVNFKTYPQGTGGAAIKLAEICADTKKKTGVVVIPLVQVADIFRITSQGFIVWAQHVDDIDFGPNTGQILPQSVFAAGAKGTLLNHSENKLPTQVIGSIVVRCSKLGLKTLVCTESIEEAQKIIEFHPDLIAYEPPELIGGEVSVSSAKPAIIKDFIAEIPGIPIVIGAGIQTEEDIEKGLRLGAKGFLVSSSVVLAKSPRAKLLELVGGYK